MALFFNRHQLYQTPGADYGLHPWSFYWWGGVLYFPLLPINFGPDISPIGIGVNCRLQRSWMWTRVKISVTTILEAGTLPCRGKETELPEHSRRPASNIRSIFPPVPKQRPFSNQGTMCSNRVVSGDCRELPGPVQQLGVNRPTWASSTSILLVSRAFLPKRGSTDSKIFNQHTTLTSNITDALKRCRWWGMIQDLNAWSQNDQRLGWIPGPGGAEADDFKT